ncbi:hypothetical protein L0F63_007107, partial [Massospora cicadina]
VESMNFIMELDVGFLIIAGMALFMNGLLVGMGLRIRHRPREMTLVLALAVIDMILPILTIPAAIYHMTTGTSIDTIPNACNVKGTVDFIGIFLSMLLVATIALTRASRILRCRIPHSIKFILAAFAVTFVILILACAVRDEFRILADGIDCAPIATTSNLSRTVLILHSFALLMFLAITVTCYLRILTSIAIDIDRHQFDFQTINPPKAPVIIRTSIIILSYLLLILPPAILLFLEAILPITRVKAINTPIDVFLASIALLNPTLVLFAHSIIFHQLALSIISLHLWLRARLAPRFST